MLIQGFLAIIIVNIYTVSWRKLVQSRLAFLTASLLVIPFFCRFVQTPSLFLKYKIPRVINQNDLDQALTLIIKDLHPDKGGNSQQFKQLKRLSELMREHRLAYDIHGASPDRLQNLNLQSLRNIQNSKTLTYYSFIFLLFLVADSNLSLLNFLLKSFINFTVFIYQIIQIQSTEVQTLPLDYVLPCWTIHERRMLIHLILIIFQIVSLPSQECSQKYPTLGKSALSYSQYKSTDLSVQVSSPNNWQKGIRLFLLLGFLLIIANTKVMPGGINIKSSNQSGYSGYSGRTNNQEMTEQELADYLDREE